MHPNIFIGSKEMMGDDVSTKREYVQCLKGPIGGLQPDFTPGNWTGGDNSGRITPQDFNLAQKANLLHKKSHMRLASKYVWSSGLVSKSLSKENNRPSELNKLCLGAEKQGTITDRVGMKYCFQK